MFDGRLRPPIVPMEVVDPHSDQLFGNPGEDSTGEIPWGEVTVDVRCLVRTLSYRCQPLEVLGHDALQQCEQLAQARGGLEACPEPRRRGCASPRTVRNLLALRFSHISVPRDTAR